MRDKVSNERLLTIHPKLRDEAIRICNEADAALTGKAILRIAYAIRTLDEQAALYAQGRTKLFDASGKRLGIVTNAAAGWSCHNYGLALDIVLLVDNDGNGTHEAASWDTVKDFDKDGKSDWMEVLEIFKKNGWTLGKEFKSIPDAPHVEKMFGYNIKQLLEKSNKKDFITGTTYVNI